MLSIKFTSESVEGIRLAVQAFLADTYQQPEPRLCEVGTPEIATFPGAEPPTRKRRTKAEMLADAEKKAADAFEATLKAGAESEAAREALNAAETLARREAARILGAVHATAEPLAPAPAADKPAPATFSDAKLALTRVVQTPGLGIAAGADLLKDAGVARLAQLPEDQWGAFIAACEAALSRNAVPR